MTEINLNSSKKERAEEVLEVLNSVPSLIVKWGIAIISFWLLLLLVMSWFVKYPDKINGKLTLSTVSPPISVVTRSQGRLNFFVKENQLVKKDQFLGIINNTANNEDILDVFEKIDQCNSFIFKDFDAEALPDFNEKVELGEVQGAYLNFIKTVSEYKIFKELELYENLFAGIRDRIGHYKLLDGQLIEQKNIAKLKFEVNNENFKTDSILFKNGVLSETEFKRSKIRIIEEQNSYANFRSNITNNKIMISQLESQINELVLEQQQKIYNFKSEIRYSFKQLYQELKTWKQRYLLLAPCDGTISLLKFISNNQFVVQGEVVIVVVPPGQEMYGKMVIPMTGSGKVKHGQEVILKFDGYPSTEFGTITGIVKNISLVPHENIYYINVSLPEGLVTNYGKKLVFKQEMLATAEIITKKRRLLARIFNKFQEIFYSAS